MKINELIKFLEEREKDELCIYPEENRRFLKLICEEILAQGNEIYELKDRISTLEYHQIKRME